MKDEAVRPGRSIASVVRELKQADKKIDPAIDPSDAAIAELADMPGWKKLAEYIQARIAYIHDMFRGKIGEDSFELIGQKAIISDIVEDELRGLLNRVEGARKVVEENASKSK